ncbi:hypothetical protein QFC19_003674 [Naganishia cerealis]|uniref:Uncharacterized protein n=1 Tax=Naganishia cerealis TaxID=610337 RepID=A0ACC2W0S4_9TREE|nr:hypothetical protein QFC19_003674 [Naganishia cerealis]
MPAQPSSEVSSQHIPLPSQGTDAASLASQSKRNRGRPRKWASEADRRAAEAQRRRDTAFAKKHGLSLPPRASGTFRASPSEESEAERTSGRAPSTRNPYIYFDRDFGHHTPGTEDAISARDLIVNWLASGDNYKAFTAWSVPERDAACRQLKAEMESHGMSEREVLSIRQQRNNVSIMCVQITFIQRGAREARRFELAHEYDEMSPNDLRKVAPLLDANTTPKQGKSSIMTCRNFANTNLITLTAMIKRRWPYYEKLKEHVIAEILLQPIEGQSQPNGQFQDEIGNIGVDLSADGMDQRSLTPSTLLISGLADTTLAQALRGVGQWRGTNDPSELDIAAVTSRANQIIHTAGAGDDRPPGSRTTTTIQQSNHRFPVPVVQPPASKASSRREAEAWDLEKQQIRQKLELEKEDRRAKDRITERELHLQSIKAFRELLRDGLTRNQAGRVVWQNSWPAMKKSMDEEDE